MSYIIVCRVLRRVMHEMVPASQVIWYAPSLICMLIAPQHHISWGTPQMSENKSMMEALS